MYQYIDHFTKIDFIIAFLFLFSVFSYLFVLPQYEQNMNVITDKNEELQREIKRDIKQQDIQHDSNKNLIGTALIEISKLYQYAEVTVLDAKYDPQNQQVQLQLQGKISNLIKATNHLQQYKNIELISLNLIQDDLKMQPKLNVVWQVQAHL